MPNTADRLAAGLAAIANDRRDDARQALRAAGDDGALLARALLEQLDVPDASTVYDRPAAFEAFIRGGDNVPLYAATSAALARLYDDVDALLDIGCGDGMALIPALEQARRLPRRIDLVEPSQALLASATAQLQAGRLSIAALDAHHQPAQRFAETLPPGQHWDLAQSTFALQALPPDERQATLRRLRPHLRRFALVEFDVPVLAPGSAAHYASLARRYQRALDGYGDDAPLVAGGFLAPMLLGQLRTNARPSNWEQPMSGWIEAFAAAGYALAAREALYDYSWSPAVLLVFE